MTTTNLSARQVIALQQAPGGVWRPAELIYMPEMTLRQLWGPQKTLSLRHLDLVYYEFDEPFVRSALAASDLDAFVEGAASTLQAPLEANERLTLRIAPDRSALWEDEALMQVDGLSDLPLGDLVPTPTPGVFTPLAPLPNTSELSTVVGSTDLDVGLTIFSRLRRVAFLELARRIAGETDAVGSTSSRPWSTNWRCGRRDLLRTRSDLTSRWLCWLHCRPASRSYRPYPNCWRPGRPSTTPGSCRTCLTARP